jgi:hypothetical protein
MITEYPYEIANTVHRQKHGSDNGDTVLAWPTRSRLFITGRKKPDSQRSGITAEFFWY